MEPENIRLIQKVTTTNEIIVKVETEDAESVDDCLNEETEYQGQLCRLCANSINTGIYIFNGAGREQQLADKINRCLPVTVKVTDILPKQLCVPCKNKLNICYDFAESCVKAERKLKRIMEIHSVALPVSGTLTTVYNCLNQNSKTIDMNDYDKLYCCPLCYEGNMILQNGMSNSEEIDLEDNLRHGINGETLEMCHNNKVEQIDSIINCDSEGMDFAVSEESINVDKEENTQENLETIFPMTFMCRFCDHFCPDLKSSSTHSKYHEDENGFPCVLCEDYFKTEEEVENHFKNHNLEMVKKMSKPKVEIIEQNHNVSDSARLCKCPDCGKIFGTTERLSFHIQFHNGAKPFVCERCMKEFTSENLLFRHMNLVHGGTEICKKCGATFMSEDKLNSHICALIKQPFRCKICRKEFQDTTLLRKHTTTHNFILAKPFQCNQCDASFTRISKLNEHVENSHCKLTSQVCIKCTLCKMVFPNMEFAMLHIRKHVTSDQEDCKLAEELEVAMLFCCEYCEAVFTYVENLIQHSSQHSGVNPYHCTFCNMLFSDHNQMKFHKRYHFEHENQCNELNLFSVPLLFVCEACEKSFSTWKGLQIHYNIMHNSYVKGNLHNADRKNRKEEEETCHLCEDCGESFQKRADLRRHKLKVHRPKNRFPCEECGKVLLHYSGLVIHRRQHTGERPFMCDVCGKSFPQAPAMYTHRRTHTRDYPYRCELCGQTFNNKGDLNNHRRSKHTKERPFKCTVCNKSFLTSGVYYQHKQLHAGIRKYKCTHCERAFSRWNALSIHIKSHTGEKPHACHVCGRGFAQKGDMKKHMKTQHGVMK